MCNFCPVDHAGVRGLGRPHQLREANQHPPHSKEGEKVNERRRNSEEEGGGGKERRREIVGVGKEGIRGGRKGRKGGGGGEVIGEGKGGKSRRRPSNQIHR